MKYAELSFVVLKKKNNPFASFTRYNIEILIRLKLDPIEFDEKKHANDEIWFKHTVGYYSVVYSKHYTSDIKNDSTVDILLNASQAQVFWNNGVMSYLATNGN